MKNLRSMIASCCVGTIAIQLLFPLNTLAAIVTVDEFNGTDPIPVKATGDLLHPDEINSITDVLRGLRHDEGTNANVIPRAAPLPDLPGDTSDDTLIIPFDLDVTGDIEATGKVCNGTGKCVGQGQWTEQVNGSNVPQALSYDDLSVGIGFDAANTTVLPKGQLHINRVGGPPPLVLSTGNFSTWALNGSTYDIVMGDSGSDYWGLTGATNFSIGNNVTSDLLNLDPNGNLTLSGDIRRNAHNNGFLVGSYNSVGENSTRSNPIYTIGSNYKPNTTTLGNMYGIGYTHSNSSFLGGSGWGFYVAADGDARNFISGSNGGKSYFNAGNVGIGTNNPVQRLHVQDGNIQISGTSWRHLRMSGGGSSNLDMHYGDANNELRFGRYSPTWTWESNPVRFDLDAPNNTLMVSASGNVGIGTANPVSKLDIVGGVKLSDDAAICNATKEGTVRYNTTDQELQLCNGTDWEPVGTGAGGGGTEFVRGVCTYGGSYTNANCSCSDSGTNNATNQNLGLSAEYKIVGGGCNLDGTGAGINSSMRVNDNTWNCQSSNAAYNVESIDLVCERSVIAAPTIPACTNGQVLVYNETTSTWDCGTASSAGENCFAITKDDIDNGRVQNHTSNIGSGSANLVNITGESGYLLGGNIEGNLISTVTVVVDGVTLPISTGFYEDEGGADDAMFATLPAVQYSNSLKIDYTATSSSNKVAGVAITKKAGGSCSGGGGASLPACINGQILVYNETTATWDCGAPALTAGGSAAAFHVHMNGTNQVIPTSSYTPLVWNTKDFDTNNDFNLATNRFTPKLPGKYILTASILSGTTNNGGAVVARIKKNGVTIGDELMRNGSTSAMTAKALVIVEANGTTDYFEAEGYVAGGTHLIMGQPYRTYFSGALLDSGDGVIAGGGLPVCTDQQTLVYDTDTTAWMCHDNPNNPVYFQVARMADQNLPTGTVLKWDTKVNDPDNVIDIATGAFVAPRNGVYYLHADILGQISTANGNYRLYKNGVNINITGYGVGGVNSYKQSTVATTIPLQVGDRIDIRSQGTQYVHGSAYHTRFTGFMLTSLAEAKVSPAGPLPACMDGQALIYNDTTSLWECGKGTNTISFQVAKSAYQTTSGSLIVSWDTMIENNSSGFDLIQNHFTAPEDGTYFFHSVVMSPNDTSTASLRLYKNGVNTGLASYTGNNTSGHSESVLAATLTLAAGDVIDVRTTSGKHLYGAAGTYHSRFSGFMVNRSGSGSHNTTFPACGNGQRIAYNSTTKNWECAAAAGKFISGVNPVEAIYTGGNVGIGTTDPTHTLDVRGQLKIDQGAAYDLWIQGGNATSGEARNLALLGVKASDTLYLNHAGEYTGGVIVMSNIQANGFFYLSDKNLKENIKPLINASDILKIGAKTFDWKDTGKHDIGVIAQDVEQYFPEAVKTDKKGIKAVDYPKLVAPLIGVVKDQQAQIEALEERLEKLENK